MNYDVGADTSHDRADDQCRPVYRERLVDQFIGLVAVIGDAHFYSGTWPVKTV